MELALRRHQPQAEHDNSTTKTGTTTQSFYDLNQIKKSQVIPSIITTTTASNHSRKLSTESSSNGNRSMNVSPSPPTPSSSHLQSPLTVNSTNNIPQQNNNNNNNINSNQLSKEGDHENHADNAILINSQNLITNHQHLLDEEDPLFISTEDGEQLEQPRAVTRNFHSTTSINDRRHTEPTRAGFATTINNNNISSSRSNSLKPKILTRHSTFPLPASNQEIIHLKDEDNPIANEVERLRNSIISKRQLKKKRKEFLEDEKVLVGNKVSEGHSNYVMAYNMLTGIRVSVSRVSGVRKPLTDLDFSMTKKLAFDVSGSELTPSSRYDFKFKDYSPTVFRELRLIFGLDPADYLVSLTSKYILSELGSPGKSGSFFYYSRDYRFIIKTIHHSEHRQLRNVLKDYYNYVKENPNTLLSQFYGLHRLKMRVNGRPKKVHFIVMNNLFPLQKNIHKQYDLKGSTDGRYTRHVSPDSPKSVVYKDLNWLEDGYGLKLKGPDKQQLVNQLRKDVKLLQKLNIMDYSMLIGVHDCKLDNTTHGERLSIAHPVDNNSLSFTIPKSMIEAHDDEDSDGFYQCLKSDDNDYIYYIGVIDCLTRYSTLKKLETLMRKLNHSKNFSCINATDYGDRFIKFMETNVFRKDKQE